MWVRLFLLRGRIHSSIRPNDDKSLVGESSEVLGLCFRILQEHCFFDKMAHEPKFKENQNLRQLTRQLTTYEIPDESIHAPGLISKVVNFYKCSRQFITCNFFCQVN